ncbi:MAG: hypothetical protein FJW99_04260 [Actinobacteria bacterium]|nr:hypothetical protein [Actinomycetota bacterium]
MGWNSWTITGSAIALIILLALGLAYAIVRGLRLKRRVGAAIMRMSPILAGISASAGQIEDGIAKAEEGARELSAEIERLRLRVAELQVISGHALAAIKEIRGPLGWLAGVRALVKYRGR